MLLSRSVVPVSNVKDVNTRKRTILNHQYMNRNYERPAFFEILASTSGPYMVLDHPGPYGPGPYDPGPLGLYGSGPLIILKNILS